MVDRIDRNVDVEVGPVKMFAVEERHVLDLADGSFPKPGKCLEREEHLTIRKERPDPVLRDLRDFNH